MEFSISGRTVITISHRLSTIQKVDEILVMSEGKVTERGDHAHLINRRGSYYNLWLLSQKSE